MSNLTEWDLVEAIDDVLEGRPLLKWDYFVSVAQGDPVVRCWIQQMRDLEDKYSDRDHGKMLTDEGIEELRKLRSELCAAASRNFDDGAHNSST